MTPPLRLTRGLLVHGGALGDFVLALRLVALLRAAGATRVTALARPAVARVAVPGGAVDDLLDLDSCGAHSLFSADAPVPARLAAALHGFDLAIDLLSDPAGPFPRRLASLTSGRVLSLDPRPRAECREHITDQWLAALTRHGLSAAAPPPRIRVDSASRAAARAALAAPPDSQLVLIHPGSGGRAKCWPLDTFAALAAALARAGCAVRFILGPAERERLSPAAQQQLSDAAPLLAPSDACDLAATLSVATLYVGNDSGVSHLAAAVGAPTVAIFGATDPRVWRPLGDSVHVLGGPQGFPALADVERVVTAQLRALRDVAARSAAE